MNSIPDFIKNSARKFPEKTALISSNRKFSYTELEDEISSFSSSLLEYPKDSVISMFFENSADFIISYFGILNSACVAHIIPNNISLTNLKTQINSANPKLIITSKKNFDTLQKLNLDTNVQTFDEIKNQITDNISRIPNSDDYAYLIYTSGTTSIPKGVGITHSNALFTTNNIVNVLQYTFSDIDVLPLPLSHSFGLGCMHT